MKASLRDMTDVLIELPVKGEVEKCGRNGAVECLNSSLLYHHSRNRSSRLSCASHYIYMKLFYQQKSAGPLISLKAELAGLR